MDNLIQLAMQIVFCLLIAAVLGAIIGYLLGKMSKCGKDEYDYDEFSEKKVLNDYTTHNDKQFNEDSTQGISKTTTIDRVKNIKKSDLKVSKKTIDAVKEDTTFVTGTGQEIGIRPESVDAPMNGEIEDLKEISGVGIKIEEVLHSLGIYHFEQIAKWSPENIEWIENYLTLKGRIKKEDWINQAKLLAAGGQTEFSKKVRRGENRNYN